MAKLVASIFNEYLSVLFEDFSSKNVNSKLFTGKINIQNVRAMYGDPLVPVFPEWRRKKTHFAPQVNVRKDLLKEVKYPPVLSPARAFNQMHSIGTRFLRARTHLHHSQA